MKKKIILFFYIIFLSYPLSAGNYCPECNIEYDTNFNFCPIHGNKISQLEVKILPVETSKSINSDEHKKQVDEKERESVSGFYNRIELLDRIKNHKFDYKALFEISEKYFEKDKKIAYASLEYLYIKYPEDYNVIKLFADYYLSIQNFEKALELYNQIEQMINEKISKNIEKLNTIKN